MSNSQHTIYRLGKRSVTVSGRGQTRVSDEAVIDKVFVPGTPDPEPDNWNYLFGLTEGRAFVEIPLDPTKQWIIRGVLDRSNIPSLTFSWQSRKALYNYKDGYIYHMASTTTEGWVVVRFKLNPDKTPNSSSLEIVKANLEEVVFAIDIEGNYIYFCRAGSNSNRVLYRSKIGSNDEELIWSGGFGSSVYALCVNQNDGTVYWNESSSAPNTQHAWKDGVRIDSGPGYSFSAWAAYADIRGARGEDCYVIAREWGSGAITRLGMSDPFHFNGARTVLYSQGTSPYDGGFYLNKTKKKLYAISPAMNGPLGQGFYLYEMDYDGQNRTVLSKNPGGLSRLAGMYGIKLEEN